MKRQYLIPALVCGIATFAGSSKAAILLTENFETLPARYTLPAGSEFRFQASAPTRYWGTTDLGFTPNPAITGNTSIYLAGQNMDPDGDGTLTFTTGTPAMIDFNLNVGPGNSNLTLTIDLAGMPNAEIENYVRAVTDDDGDGFYESTVFNFAGSGNTAYSDFTLGSLGAAFQTFTAVPVNTPTTADNILRLRFEIFNDTNSQNEALALDNVIISGAIPEPTSLALFGTALGILGMRRRRA